MRIHIGWKRSSQPTITATIQTSQLSTWTQCLLHQFQYPLRRPPARLIARSRMSVSMHNRNIPLTLLLFNLNPWTAFPRSCFSRQQRTTHSHRRTMRYSRRSPMFRLMICRSSGLPSSGARSHARSRICFSSSESHSSLQSLS